MNRYYVCYCLLQNNQWSRQLSRRLFELQDYYGKIAPGNLLQAFVFGNGDAVSRPFRKYPRDTRVGLEPASGYVHPEDMLTLSWRIMEKAMRTEKNADFRLVFLADSTVEEEPEGLLLAEDLLRSLKGNGLEIYFVSCSPGTDCGALRSLIDRDKRIDAGTKAETVLGGR